MPAAKKQPPPAPQKPQPQAARFRDRIVELRRVKASELLDNPKNWRRHPDEQVSALTSMMERIGFTGAAIGRLDADGRIQLLDGHLRKTIAADQEVPVLITNLSDEEAEIFLASFDPLTELAIADQAALHSLLKEIHTDEDSWLRKLMLDTEDELAKGEEVSDEVKEAETEGMALEPHEHYDYLLVLAQTSHEWNVLCERLGLVPEKRRYVGMGTCRAIRATKLLERLPKKD